MGSKLVIDRERSADKVTAVQTHGDEAAANENDGFVMGYDRLHCFPTIHQILFAIS